MTDHFHAAFKVLMHNEGGYSDNPADDGGETKFGISKKQYPHLDIKRLSLEEAKAIYRRDYWNKFGCQFIESWPIALVMFDCLVNHNPKGPAKWLQKALLVQQDGKIGPLTIAAANTAHDKGQGLEVAKLILIQRIKHFAALGDWPTFSTGWTKRCFDTYLAAAMGEGNALVATY